MSWWGSSPIEGEIARATSSSIPSGEQDLALNLEICDTVRSKQATPNEALRALKKRLYDTNPNVQILTLHLLDLLVKNAGAHFFIEFAAKEFVDAYVAELLSLQNQQRNLEVVGLMLEYLQMWARASTSKPEAKYLQEKYVELQRRKDIVFPEIGTEGEISSSFLESATAPEWMDSDRCMKSGQLFSFYNRKHHCRNCGGVFLQEYCANFIPLPHFGINIPVRVCDDCNAKIARKSHRAPAVSSDMAIKPPQSPSYTRGIASNNSDIGSRFRQDLEEAMRLSLKSGQQQEPRPAPTVSSGFNDDEGLDDDMRRAIAASLAEIGPSATSNGVATPSTALQTLTSEPQAPAPVIPPKDREALDSYIELVHSAEPREAIYNTRLTELNRRAIELQPKVISELRVSTSKLGTLEDLHGKLLAVASYYDRLLEAELNPGQYIPPVAPQSHSYPHPANDTGISQRPDSISDSNAVFCLEGNPDKQTEGSDTASHKEAFPEAPLAGAAGAAAAPTPPEEPGYSAHRITTEENDAKDVASSPIEPPREEPEPTLIEL